MKPKTIKLAHFHNVNRQSCYRVVQVTDSLEFHPGQYLTAKEAEELCASTQWKVTVVAS